jgi:hypothetical protein
MRFTRVVDDGLDPQGPAVFEVGLDAGVPVEGVDDHAVVVPVDGGAEHALGDAADLPVEDDLHVVWAADVEVVGGQGLEERPGMAGGGEGDGLGDLDLPHGDVPPVAGLAVGVGERQRQPCPPAFGEHPDLAGAEPVADLLQRGRVLTGSEPVRQVLERQARPGRLALGPLVPVEPDFARVREIGADLDERRPESFVPDVEVVAGHPAFGAIVREPHRAGGGLVLGPGEHPLVLLRHADRDHLGTPGSGGLAHQRHHLIDLAFRPRAIGQHPRPALVPLARETQHRDVIGLSEGGHRTAERLPPPLQQCRRGDRVLLVHGQEAHHLTANHQVRDRQGQVDPVHAVDLQQLVPVQHVIDRDRISSHQT